MGFYFYRRYYFKNSVTSKWDALALAKKADQDGALNSFFDQEWVKMDDEHEPSGWGKGIKKQLLGK